MHSLVYARLDTPRRHATYVWGLAPAASAAAGEPVALEALTRPLVWVVAGDPDPKIASFPWRLEVLREGTRRVVAYYWPASYLASYGAPRGGKHAPARVGGWAAAMEEAARIAEALASAEEAA